MITEGISAQCGMVLIAGLGQTAEAYGGVTNLKKYL